MNAPEKVLCFSPYGFWTLHALYEIALCHNLKARGHEFVYVGCDGLFTDCDLFWESTCGPRPASACTVCQNQVKKQLDALAIAPEWLSKFRRAEDETEAKAFIAGVVDSDLERATFEGLPIAAWVRSSVHTHLRINTIDLKDPKHAKTFRSYIYNGAIAARALLRLLDTVKPTVLLLFNGRMSLTRIAFELARARGIRVICHERGATKETLQLWENQHCLSLQPYGKLWSNWGHVPLTSDQVARTRYWLLQRAAGKNLNWKTFSVQSSLGRVESFIGANAGKPLWALFTSSTDEIATNPEFTSVFGTQYRWIESTVEFARQHPEIALVIRVHPNSGSKVSTGRNREELAFFAKTAESLPQNVALVMPEESVSSYAVGDRCDLGLVYCTTMGLELACRGKPVIGTARSFYGDCDAITKIPSPAEYHGILGVHAIATRTAVDTVRTSTSAFRYAHAYIARRNIPFPLVHMPDVHTGQLAIRAIQELAPGWQRCLDYCADIVLGKRPAIPVPEKSDMSADPAEEAAAIRDALAVLSGKVALPKRIRASIVITCYNYGQFLRTCVESAVKQTFQEREIIIVNDGSTDNSLDVAKACVAEWPDQDIRVVDQPNSGQPALSRNAGIKVARGEFILPIDADDSIDPGYLERCFSAIDAYGDIDLAYADSIYVSKSGKKRVVPGLYHLQTMTRGNQLVYCSLYRKAIWEKIGGYRDNVRGYEDWDFWVAALLVGAKAIYVPCIGLMYNDKDGGVFSQTVSKHAVRMSQLIVNNPKAFTKEQVEGAKATLRNPPVDPPKPAATLMAPANIEATKAGAVESYTAGNFAACVTACAEALKAEPDNADLMLVCVDALTKLGRAEEALAILDRLISLQPEVADHRELRKSLAAAFEASKRESKLATAPALEAMPETKLEAAFRGKKVVLYSDDPGFGGAAHYNHTVMVGLACRGAQVFSAHPKHDTPLVREQEQAGIRHCWLSYDPARPFTASFTDDTDARRIFGEVKPDLIYFSDCCAVSNIAAKRAAVAAGIPFVVICHSEAGYLAERFPQVLNLVADHLARAAQVVSVSQSSRGVLLRHFGLKPSKGVVIYNGRPKKYFVERSNDAREKVRSELGLPPDAVLCLTVARFDSGKGYQYQLEAIARLKAMKRLGPLYFAWAGEGDVHAQIASMVEQHGLKDRVRMLGYRWDVPNLIDASDIFILTSCSEAFPLCTLEAMAKGVPVIASNLGGIPEELGDTGKLVPNPTIDPQGTVKELMETLALWASDPKKREQLGVAAKQRATTMFQEERMVDETMAVIATALQREKPPANASVPDNHAAFQQLVQQAQELARRGQIADAAAALENAAKVAPTPQAAAQVGSLAAQMRKDKRVAEAAVSA